MPKHQTALDTRPAPPKAPPTKATGSGFVSCHAGDCKATKATAKAKRWNPPRTPQTHTESLLSDALDQSNAYGRNITIAFGIQGFLLLIVLICLFVSKI